MTDWTITVTELRRRLSDVLDRAARGEERFFITRFGEVIAVIKPIAAPIDVSLRGVTERLPVGPDAGLDQDGMVRKGAGRD